MNAAFIRIGLSACDIGVSYFLPRLSARRSRRSCCSPAASSPPSARSPWASSPRVVPDAGLESEARNLAQEMLATRPSGCASPRSASRPRASTPAASRQAIAMEDRNQILVRAASRDFREGVAAFLEQAGAALRGSLAPPPPPPLFPERGGPMRQPGRVCFVVGAGSGIWTRRSAPLGRRGLDRPRQQPTWTRRGSPRRRRECPRSTHDGPSTSSDAEAVEGRRQGDRSPAGPDRARLQRRRDSADQPARSSRTSRRSTA